ncbi:MAG: hypothetical protein CL675_05955 [Bdellovibrionaceae bacterium]|nr:hypothetical protein [Pseudobdellovibrionaceae bacterium]
MALVSYTCFDCGTNQEIPKEFSRRQECESCGADTHACKNCQFHDPSAYNECREPSAEVVREKERSNFCDYFQLKSPDGSASSSKDDLLSAAEALFKKK